MASEPLRMRPGGAAELAETLRALIPAASSVSDAVAEILAAVRSGGDAAVAELTRRFDTGGSPAPALRVSEADLDFAAQGLEPELEAGLRLALENVLDIARAGRGPARTEVSTAHSEIALREEPVE